MAEPVVKRTNGKRNRSAGHSFELKVKDLLVEAGWPHVVTCRSESRSRDNQGIDLINKNEAKNGRLPYNIQCKNATKIPNYIALLTKMPKEPGIVNVVLHKHCTRTETGMFHPKGHYAVVHMDDFLALITELKRLKEQV